MSDLKVAVCTGDEVSTKFGRGVVRGRYSNYTTTGVIVEIKGVNHYLAYEAVHVLLSRPVAVKPELRTATRADLLRQLRELEQAG